MDKVRCRDCRRYPEWNRQPGSDMCISVASERSLESRPCEPELRSSAARTQAGAAERRVPARVRKTVGQSLFIGPVILGILLIFGILISVIAYVQQL